MSKRFLIAHQHPRTVILTGGSRGLGSALAKSLACKNNKVYVFSRGRMVGQNDNIHHIQCDISSEEEVERMLQIVNKDIGHADIWINNAAVSGGYNKLQELRYDVMWSTVNTNLTASIVMTKFAMQLMATQNNGGHIFNMSGAGGDHSKTPFFSVYGATKSGIVQFSKSVQAELKQQKNNKVFLHVISPGLMKTQLLLENLDPTTMAIMDILADSPSTVADSLSKEIMRTVLQPTKSHTFIRYFNILNILKRLSGIQKIDLK